MWVISASPRLEIEVFAERYGILPSRVIGLRRKVVDGVISLVNDRPISYSDGKLDAFQHWVTRDRPPTFAAGDSLGDWKMLEWAEEARLLIEPAPDRLRDFARWRLESGETWLLQKFD